LDRKEQIGIKKKISSSVLKKMERRPRMKEGLAFSEALPGKVQTLSKRTLKGKR